jgi:NADH dehydrogenase/NADH:ubiquinone oxidoreductase subunit G
MEIIINGKTCVCEKGEFLWKVARRNGIDIPTLCHHEGLPEQGCCRVCIVEVVEKGRSKVVVSCVYPVERPCEVYTDNELIREERAVILMLLRKRAPESAEIQALCEKYGAVETDRFKPLDGEKCILCGLCVRACASLGTGAISTVNRGITKMISTPYEEPNLDCLGCASCAFVCPTGAIAFTDEDGVRSIWGRDFPLVRCQSCHAPIGTEQELAYAARRLGAPKEALCVSCRKKKISDVLAHISAVRPHKNDRE